MIIGRLTGNGKPSPLDGSYTFYAPGLVDPLPPDLAPEQASRSGPFSFAEGALTDGDGATGVGWQAATVGETGVDVVIDLGMRCFLDRVIVRRPPPRSAARAEGEGIEAIGHLERDGLSRVEIYAVLAEEQGPALVGHAGERGPDVLPEGPIAVSVGVEAQELTVRLFSPRRDIRLAELEVWGAGPGDPALFPVPARMERLAGGPFVLNPGAAIWVGPAASEETRFAAALLAEKLAETWGWTVRVATEEGSTPPTGTILIGKAGESAHLDAARLPAPEEPEGYTLRVTAEGAALLARDRRGLVYAAESLLQLLTRDDIAPTAPACLIEDAPRLPFRGVHLFLPARDQLDYTKRLIRHLLVPMKLNTIFLELAGGMRFDRRPEISETWARNNRLAAAGKAPPVPHGEVCGGGWITQAEVKDLVDYARSYGLEVIPEIQSLSHVQYLTMTYPQIAEKLVEQGYPDAYCPLLPESREIVFDMIDEVVDLLGPLRYLHMGHDEVYTMAECPRCQGKSRGELYAHDVQAIYDYLQTKGVGMMVWADMLQPWQPYAGPDAAAVIPKDIVMLEFVWYFRPWADTEDLLLEKGFPVIFGNCYSSHFTRYEARTHKPGVIGAQVSVWAGTNEEDMGRLGKLYDMIYSANTAWSAACQDELRWTFGQKIADLMPAIRARLRGQPAPSQAETTSLAPLDLGPQLTAPRRDPAGSRGGYDLTTLPAGAVTWRDRPFQLGEGVILVESPRVRPPAYPEQVTVPVGAQVSGLVFAHTCTAMGPVGRSIGPRRPIARYQVAYADGTTEAIDVAYGYHVAEWNRRHGAPLEGTFHRHAGYVATYPVDPLWQGKTAQGEDVTVYGMEWTNPHPQKEVQAVCIVAADSGTNAALLVVGITAVLRD